MSTDQASKPCIINNSRRRSLAERIIDLIAQFNMFESVKVYVNHDCLLSPELGDAKAKSAKTKTGIRFAVSKAPDYAKNLMSYHANTPHIILITFDGLMYDNLNKNPSFCSTFQSYLTTVTEEYDCHHQFVSPSCIAIYPNDANSAKPFAAKADA